MSCIASFRAVSLRKTGIGIGIALLSLSACSSPTSSPQASADGATRSADPTSTGGPSGAGQPDVNGDGKVIIGMMSPGDTRDNGYYQSFVDEARSFAEEKGWTVITIDKVNPADAMTQAKNLCLQDADLIAIDSNELDAALDTATSPECADVNYYINGAMGVEQKPSFAQSQDIIAETMLTVGYAAGLLMKEKGATKAGFVSGPEADFTTQAADAILAGMQRVVPDATLLETYTGDFNDSAKAKEAAQAQLDSGVAVIYPYLGGATDSVTALANDAGVMTITPGTDRCEDPSVSYDVSAVFSPGAYFAGALREFEAGSLEMGKTRVWHIGADPVPTVRMCAAHEALQSELDTLMADIASGEIDPTTAAVPAQN